MKDVTMLYFDNWVVSGALSVREITSRHSHNKASLGMRFKQSSMINSWGDIKTLFDIIAKSAGCMIRKDTRPVGADARDGFTSYVVDLNDFLNVYPDGVRPRRNF